LKGLIQSEAGRAAEQAAAIVGTNRQYVSDAKKIEREAPDLLTDVRDGALTIPEAKKLVAQPEPIRVAVRERITTGQSCRVPKHRSVDWILRRTLQSYCAQFAQFAD
jgi:hypothetical protein